MDWNVYLLSKVVGIFRGYTGTGEVQNAILILGYLQIKWFLEVGQYYFQILERILKEYPHFFRYSSQ